MAGTGLPIPKTGGVLAEEPGPLRLIDGDRLSSAHAWNKLAQVGTTFADGALDLMKIEQKQQLARQTADSENKWDVDTVKLRDKNAFNPKGYEADMNGYIEGVLSTTPEHMLTHAKNFLGGKMASGLSSVLSETRHRDTRLAGESLDARRISADNDVMALALAGKVGTPDFAAAQVTYKGVLDTQVSTGLMTPEKRDLLMDDLAGRAQGEHAARSGVEVYREKGFEAAAEHLRKDILENDKLSLKTAERYKIFNRGMAAINLAKKEDTADKAGIMVMASNLRARVNSGQDVDKGELQDMFGYLNRVGAVAEYSRLARDVASREATAPWRSGSVPLGQMGQQMRTMRSPVGTPEQATSISASASRLGISPRDLAAAISYETGGRFDPNMWGGKNNNHLGLIQFGGPEREKYGVKPGMSFEQQMVAVEGFLRDRGVKPGMGISEIYRTINGGNPNANLNASDGNGTIAQHIQRIQAGHYPNADKFLGGTGGAMHPPMGEVVKLNQQVYVEHMRKTWPAMEAMIAKGRTPDAEDFEAIRYAAELSGDAAWIKNVEARAVAAGFGEGETAATRQAGLDRVKSAAAQGGWSIDEDAVVNKIEEENKRQLALARDNPVAYHVERGGAAPGAFDLSSPQSARTSMNERVTIAKRVAAGESIPEGNPLGDADRAMLAATITRGTPQQAGVAFGALASVPDDMLVPTLKADDIKAAVTGALRGGDPAKYGTAMTFIDGLWQRAPQTTKDMFGEEAVHQLMTWQSNLRYMTPDQLAKEREKATADPQVRERRKTNEAAGREIASKMTPDEVVKKFDTSWWVTPGPIARNVTDSQPLAPVDTGTRDALMGDYQVQFARRYSETLDANAAHEQAVALLKTKWARSEVNGGRLMLRAPETAYPAVNGSHDWMKKQIEADLTAKFGEKSPVLTIAPGEDLSSGKVPAASYQPRDWDYTIVPDGKTAGESVPRYQVIIRNNRTANPQWDVVLGDDGKPLRYGWDAGPAQSKAQEAFQAERKRILAEPEPSGIFNNIAAENQRRRRRDTQL